MNDIQASREERIWQVISLIPHGKVASYGQVAALAGLPRRARLVGRVLSNLPATSKLPWHRVVNAQGRIAFPSRSPDYRRQRSRLREEGIILKNGRIPLKTYQWRPGAGSAESPSPTPAEKGATQCNRHIPGSASRVHR